jgi:hypothetical protein
MREFHAQASISCEGAPSADSRNASCVSSRFVPLWTMPDEKLTPADASDIAESGLDTAEKQINFRGALRKGSATEGAKNADQALSGRGRFYA